MVKIKRIYGPTQQLVFDLLADIRRPDLKELCMGPADPFDTVWQSIADSKYCYVVRDRDKRLLAVFGLAAGQIDVTGVKATPIWFLGTNWAYRHNRALVYHGKEFCVRFIAEVGPLCNFIWAGNEPALRYIMHLGARLMDAEPRGNKGEMFIPFVLSEVK